MAIGQRVFVDSAGSRSGSVALADVSGEIISRVHLEDGAEVQVVAWRPRGANDTRYRVQAPHGVDGWLPAENLRSAFIAVPRVDPATPPRATVGGDSGGRRFGQRLHPERPSEPGASSGHALPPSDGGGRRFGRQVDPEHGANPVVSGHALPPGDGGGRRFGRQVDPEHGPKPFASGHALPPANSGGRRFGQH